MQLIAHIAAGAFHSAQISLAIALAVAQLRADNYNRGFNALAAFPEVFVAVPVGVLIAVTAMEAAIGPRLRLGYGFALAAAIMSISAALAIWLLAGIFMDRHGWWVEHNWYYQGNVYRAHGLTDAAAITLIVTSLGAYGAHKLLAPTRRLLLIAAAYLPLVVVHAVFLAHVFIPKPIFRG